MPEILVGGLHQPQRLASIILWTLDEMKGVSGDDAPSYHLDKHWHYQFKRGQTLMETDRLLGRQNSVIDDDSTHKVEATILEYRHLFCNSPKKGR